MNVRKSTLSLLVFSLFVWVLPAQQVSEDIRPFIKKETGNALSLIMEGQPKNVETVMEKRFLAGTGQKGKSKSGVIMYEGVRFGEISSQMLDFYIVVDKASKKDKNSSRVSLFLSTGNYNFMDSDTYPEEMANAAEVLYKLIYEARLYEMDLAIEEQQKTLEKAIKEHDKLVKDSIDLEVQLAETLQAIEDNKHARASQREAIAQEEVRLVEFKELKVETSGESQDAAVARRQARFGLPAVPTTTTKTTTEIIIGEEEEDPEEDDKN